MFVSSSDDLLSSFTCGFKKISIIGQPMMSLWFIGTFCISFISYQLETWQMLTGTAAESDQMNDDTRAQQQQTNRCWRRQHSEHDTALKSYDAQLSQIYCPTTTTKRSSRDLSDLLLALHRKGLTMDEQRRQHAGMATKISSIRNQATWMDNSAARTYDRYPALQTSSQEPLNPHKTLIEQQQHYILTNQQPQPPHRASYWSSRYPQAPLGDLRGHFRPQSSMDPAECEMQRRLAHEYSTRCNPTIIGSNHNQQATCHRRRNASYSVARATYNAAFTNPLQESLHNNPSDGQLWQANSATRLTAPSSSNFSPSSSESLPTSLQFDSNWNSESFDYSAGEPVSLPVTSSDKRPRSQQQYLPPNRALVNEIHSKQTRAFNNYYWQPEVARKEVVSRSSNQNSTPNRSVIVDRRFFRANNDNHTLQVGSDSELYAARHQQTTKRFIQQQRQQTSSTHRSHLVSSAPVSKQQTDRNTYRQRDIGDDLTRRTSSRASSNQAQSNNPGLTVVNGHHSAAVVASGKSHPTDGATSKKNGSSNRLSLAGAKRRLGFKQKGLISLSVQRSEEVIPSAVNRQFLSQMTTSSFTGSGTDLGTSWISQQQIPPTDPRIDFVEGLGAGQIASRQALVSPYLGDIQLTLSDRRGMLEVEVVRARGLQPKAGAKTLPSPYVKLYLMKNKKCLAKLKTSPARRTLDPLYQQQFIFREDYTNCILQVIVWGDYGKKDRKSLMGIVQIKIDELDITNLVISWYRMFNAPSMTDSLLSSRALRQMILFKAVDDDECQLQQK